MIREFTVTLKGVTRITDDLENRLFEAGCDDGLLHSCGKKVMLDFARDAKTVVEAVRSVKEDVAKAGYEAVDFRVIQDEREKPVPKAAASG